MKFSRSLIACRWWRSDLGTARGGRTDAHTACPLLAYPNGGTSATVESAAAAAGHDLAFTTVPRAWTAGTDRFKVPRINMWEGKVTSPFGRFSGAALDYTVYWRPFILWISELHGIGRWERFFGTRTA